MDRIVWSADLDTGIKEIDLQHRRIVTYINVLGTLRTSKNRQKQAEAIADTAQYIESHFAFEESLLEQVGYSFAGPHKKIHELFTRRITTIQERFAAGEDVVGELHKGLSRWLLGHIRTEDRAYAETVKKYLRRTRAQQTDGLRVNGDSLLPEPEPQGQKQGWLARWLAR
ncbi:bacteriohemerythrin [Comamonas nitrativorans]|uniref:Bacteriohemerythrin n=1 Tax=Comamonas nitrativorans TaxID=108437 RepID=A0ABV9GUD5_9BURK